MLSTAQQQDRVGQYCSNAGAPTKVSKPMPGLIQDMCGQSKSNQLVFLDQKTTRLWTLDVDDLINGGSLHCHEHTIIE